MKIKNLKIGTQLILSFASMLFFVIILGVVSYFQSGQLHEQTETLYDHPVKVRRALSDLKYEVVALHRDMKDLAIDTAAKEINVELDWIAWWKISAERNIDTIYSKYLGARSDVDSVKEAFLVLKTVCDETIDYMRKGHADTLLSRIKTYGIVSQKTEILLTKIDVIDKFSQNKTEELFYKSEKGKSSLTRQLILLVAAILLLMLVINYILLRSIRNPVYELTGASQLFREGDMTARSKYTSQNEFGELSSSFNSLADTLETNAKLNEKTAEITGLMLVEDEAQLFFNTILIALSSYTGAQIAAVYLRSDDNKSFNHFASIGIDDNAKLSFAVENPEGEFGTVIATKKMQHIKNIPADTRFVFHTVSGTFAPREILTIPVITNKEIIAIVSLASLNEFDALSFQLIDKILVTLGARVEGIIAYQKQKDFVVQMELQNRELEAQKAELQSQSAELTRQNTELEMQKKLLAEQGQLKTTFLSNMSHELRTPLNSVIALSGVLIRRLEKQIPEEEYSYIEVIERNGKMLLALINDILDIARIEAGREEVEITMFNANELVAEITNLIIPQANLKKIDLIHKPDDADVFITSDARKCRNILQNLIGNAVKFTEEGKVEVAVKQNRDNIEITVADTGIGISEEHIPHIFDEFRQADGSTSRRYGGTGLGLAIAKKYATMLGGSISVKSDKGKGSKFIFTLPLNYSFENFPTDTSLKNIANSDHLINVSAKSKTILLVEDSEAAIIQIRDILEETGYNILLARDGKEALAILKKTIPDAMILDLMMPGIDGFQVLKSIREKKQTDTLPVLILTAKQITKEELKFLKGNNIHQLIQKGDIGRTQLLNAVAAMVFTAVVEKEIKPRKIPVIEGKPVVLIVEDNPDNMITARALLSGIYNLIEGVDAAEGIELAKLHKPNLIIMDIGLPGMDGIEAFKIIRNDEILAHIPVVALTASAFAKDRENILACGFDAYITKPIDEKIFFKTIEKALYGK